MNKVTKEFLESEIVDVTYTCLTGTLTHCAITVKSGFVFTGESACVDEASFDEEIGKKIAYAQAFEKMWLPYGFWLKQTNGGDFIYRMENELAELGGRIDKLATFLNKGKPEFLNDEEWSLLHEQLDHMTNYFNVLNTRLAIAKSKIQQES